MVNKGDIPRSKAAMPSNHERNESIIFFLTSARDARISMHTCLVCGSGNDLLVSKKTEQLKNNPAVGKAR